MATKTKTKAKARKMQATQEKTQEKIKVLACYDAKAKLIGIELENGEKRNAESILLDDVEIVIKEGTRDGCVATGKLGYLKGYEVTGKDLSKRTMSLKSEGQLMNWQGYVFCVGTLQVMHARSVLIIGSKMYAVGASG